MFRSAKYTLFISSLFIAASLQSQTATLTPSSLSYGTQVINTTSSPKVATFKNTSSSQTITISSIATTGDYAQTNNCPVSPATLAAGASCTINVTFTPTVPGTRNGTLKVTDNAGGSPQTTTLTGVGLLPVTLTPNPVNFGNEAVGLTSAPVIVTLTNNQKSVLTITHKAISGSGAADFAQTNNCGTSLAAQSSCTFNVTFTPSTTGTFTATLGVQDNAPNSPQSTSLNGTGVVAVTLSPTSLSFGNVAVNGTSTSQAVTVTNNQTATTTISSITVTTGYTQTNNCPISPSTLAGGGSCIINVTFAPSATGSDPGTLTVTDSANNSPQTATLSGVGVVAVTLNPTSLSFGNVAVNGTSTSQAVTVTNNQSATTTISSIAATSGYTQTNNCPISPSTLAGGGTCTINVSFAPTATGSDPGTLTVTDSANNSPQIATLSGTGVVPVTLSPTTLNYGYQLTGTTGPAKSVTVTNNQSASTTISSIAVTTGYTQTNNCPISPSTLAGGGSCVINVSFAPTATGSDPGTLTVSDSANNSPQTASATASGVAANAIPATFFAMDINQNNNAGAPSGNDPWPSSVTTPLGNFAFGTYRTLGSAIKWADLYVAGASCTTGSYSFTANPTSNALYTWMNQAYQNNPRQAVMFTAYYTPDNCVPSQYQYSGGGATYCAFYQQGEVYGCDLPGDVTTGDQTWINFITQFAQYTNSQFPGLKIYLEVWNEPNIGTECNPTPNPNNPNFPGNCLASSLAQMTADANTNAKLYNSNISIVSPPPTGKATSGDCTTSGNSAAISGYLNTLLTYQNSSGTYLVGANSDYIGFHGYVSIPALGSGAPDPAAGASCESSLVQSVQNTIANLVPTQPDLSGKAIFDTEGSWGADCKNQPCPYIPNTWIRDLSNPTPLIYQVQAEEAASTGAYYLTQASNHVCQSGTCNAMAGFSWYGWDFDNKSTLPGSTGEFWNQWALDPVTGTNFTPAGVAYYTLYSWLAGATPVSPCTSSTGNAIGIWTCYFAGPNGSSSVAVWDNSQSCIGITSPCSPSPNSTFTFSSGQYTEWRDLYGDAPTQLGSTATSVNIGLVPILLDNGVVP